MGRSLEIGWLLGLGYWGHWESSGPWAWARLAQLDLHEARSMVEGKGGATKAVMSPDPEIGVLLNEHVSV